MGAWGTGQFDNDAANDFVYEILESGFSAIEASLEGILTEDGFLDADSCSEALVAIECIAALNKGNLVGLPDELFYFLKVDGNIAYFNTNRSMLLSNAVLCIDRIVDDSELKELWQESNEYKEWENNVTVLKGKLT